VTAAAEYVVGRAGIAAVRALDRDVRCGPGWKCLIGGCQGT